MNKFSTNRAVLQFTNSMMALQLIRFILPNRKSLLYSAGIGRTGTLIAIDILLQQIRDNRKLDVFGTVYRLRHHRINMVQREVSNYTSKKSM